MRFERRAVERDVRREGDLRVEVARIGVAVFAGQLVQRDRAGLKRPGEIVTENVAVQVAHTLRDRDAHSGGDRPGPVGFEADHARREKVELSRQRRRDREVRQDRRFVGRLQPFERDQVVAEDDADLRQRVDLTDRRDRQHRRQRRRRRQRRYGRQRFVRRRLGVSSTAGGEADDGRGNDNDSATGAREHVATILRARRGAPCRRRRPRSEERFCRASPQSSSWPVWRS